MAENDNPLTQKETNELANHCARLIELAQKVWGSSDYKPIVFRTEGEAFEVVVRRNENDE